VKRGGVALAWAVLVAACGARTSLEAPSSGDAGAPPDAGLDTDADAWAVVGPDIGAPPPPPPDAAAVDAPPPPLVAYAESDTSLYQVELPSGALTTIGATGETLLDIAFLSSGVLYGSGGANLDTVDPSSGATTPVGPLATLFNGLGAGPDGLLYGSGGGGISRIDPASGASTNVVGFPAGFSSSGDIATLGGVLYASTTNATASDVLVTVDVVHATAVAVGPIGYSCVYGLAAVDSTLYGFTCLGEVIRIDPFTGAGTLVASTPGVTFYGATSR
jgi:hypothetical protein